MKLGCNYWASNAGANMWQEWDPDSVRADLKVLAEHGVEYLRVFPNWRDFQPVEPLYGGYGAHYEYRLTGDRHPDNIYYLDEEMLDRFDEFCDICNEYHMKMIVGLLTGWMSGRLFIPPAVYDKNLLTDPVALYFEQMFVTGFVKRFRHKEAIYAWDHGNECSVLGNANNWVETENWIRTISNAIYAEDRTRPLITGINSLSLSGNWKIQGQADACDMLVTHPYPYWGQHSKNDTNDYIRTTVYASALTRMYRDIGGKPCLVEEIGTMGPAVCREDLAADFLNVNFFSVYANGGEGILWWCAHDQSNLMEPPYTWTMCENELGMMDNDRKPKPVLKKMKELSEIFASFDFTLPEADVDAVCLLTKNQDERGVGYMTYALAKQAGLNISFADACQTIPESKVYMLPSIKTAEFMPKERYLELLEKVKAGATLYISYDGAIIMGFEELTGNRIMDTEVSPYSDSISLNGKEIKYTSDARLIIQNMGAEQIQTPEITKYIYGKGMVYYVNFPAENMLLRQRKAFDGHVCEIYKEVFKNIVNEHVIKLHNEDVALTIHRKDNSIFAVAVNHSKKMQKLLFETDARLVKIHYGDMDKCAPMDAVIVEFEVM